MFRSRFTRNFFREQEKRIKEFMRDFDRSIEAIEPSFSHHSFFPLSFNDEFFQPITYNNPKVDIIQEKFDKDYQDLVKKYQQQLIDIESESRKQEAIK